MYIQEQAKAGELRELRRSASGRWANPLLLPWEFLSKPLQQGDFNDLGIWELKEPDTLKALAGRIKSVTFEVDEKGRKLVVVEVAAGVEGYTLLESVYRVRFLQEKQMFPISWERLSRDGHLILRYVVDELAETKTAEGKSIVYGKVARRQYFGGTKERPFQSHPYWEIAYKIDRLDSNARFEKEDFELHRSNLNH
jgi:hypothetical protein